MNRPQFESLDQMAEATAAGLSQACAGSAFELFQDKPFRQLAGFEQISQLAFCFFGNGLFRRKT